MRFHCYLAVFIVITLIGPGIIASAGDDRESPMAPQLKKMIDWLPPDTETLVVVNGPAVIPSGGFEEQTLTQRLQALGTGLLQAFHDRALIAHLKGKKVLVAIEGSRHFRSPKGLGMMPYEGCEIVRFDDSARAALRAAFKSCVEKADEVVPIEGQDVAVFMEDWESDRWNLFVALAQPTLLVCATNRDYLETVLARIKRPGETQAFPASLPEWKHIDTRSSVWAMRHYRRKDAEKDPSSPLQGKDAANEPDPKAIGFVFRWSVNSPRTATARYLTEATNGVEIATKGWNYPDEHFTPTIQEVKPGVVEIRTSLSHDLDGALLLLLMGYLGHAVYL